MADGSAGGGPTVVRTLCDHMAEYGVRSSIVTQVDSHLEAQARATGIETFTLDFSRQADVFKLRGQLGALLKRERPDIVQAHGVRSVFPAVLLGPRSRPPVVYTVHGFHHQKKQPLARLLGREVERFCIARVDRTVFVAKADVQRAKDERLLREGRYELIYNGVTAPPDLIQPGAGRSFDIAFVGRLHRQKDPLILPDILLAMRPRRPSLLIVASGELEAALRTKIKSAGVEDQVTMMPSMPRTSALAKLAQARVFILPSLWEGLPVALGEAMLLQVAVIASAIPGNMEIVEEGVTGLLAPAGDASAFAACIDRLLDSDEDRAAMTERAAAQVAEKFSARRQAEAHFRIYEALVRGRR
jgi:glycosyltransferase involved in cell wall biosynthesis